MKMKKMLAILAALSVLGTTGLTVGAEDTATTTEPATEAITTTETEAETTAAETTAETETETTVETAATEENQAVKEEGTKQILATTTCEVGEYAQGTSDLSQNDICTLSVEVYTYTGDSPIYLSILMDGSSSNLMDVVVRSSSVAGTSDAMAAQKDISSYFKVTGERTIAINVEGKWTEYDYADGQLAPAGTAPTTPEDNAIEVTPRMSLTVTGTVTYEQDASLSKNQQLVLKLDKPFYATYNYENSNLNGKTELVDSVQIWTDDKYAVGDRITVTGLVTEPLTAYYVRNISLSECTITKLNSGETTTTTTAAETTTTTTTTTTSEADLEAAEKALYEIYAAKYKPVHAIKEDVEYHIVDGVLTSATIIVQDDDEKVVKTFFVTKNGATLINSVPMGGMWYGFKSTDFTCNGYQFYAQIVQPASDADVRSYLTIYVYDKDGNLVPTNINGMQIGSVLYTGVDGKVGWTQGYDWVLSDYFSSNGDSITINRSIAAFIDVSTSMQYTLTSDSTTYTYDAATNTFLATNGTNSGTNSGKTDNGSASNAPATKNTSGTPKTGDTTTVPAVAVGLTLTAAGVVAFISKRKK